MAKFMVLVKSTWVCQHGFGYPDLCPQCKEGMTDNPQDNNNPSQQLTNVKEKSQCR